MPQTIMHTSAPLINAQVLQSTTLVPCSALVRCLPWNAEFEKRNLEPNTVLARPQNILDLVRLKQSRKKRT